ncbi:flagellar biosynthesis protein FlaG [Alteromonas sp. MB-3u-76]|uniref:flagellar protein FlaG n=1 Tax=Alteromonas sp. MB-3u-76 TaxID=2058133 RepID=UPI000C302512|nr:flagellar protein FlaG [Alteromonas sp. MB-3u-76]AUC87630.1 flagellar biosynthesis protein FlaG [Alteromonas sp. MB-3u-76]
MDIQNTQGGQVFATALPVKGEMSLQSPQVQQSEVSNSNEISSQSVPLNTENLRNVTQDLPQVIQGTTDIKNNLEDDSQLGNAISRVESFLQGQNRNLSFSIDENTKRSVVTVLDSDSGDVIRQIPSEEILMLAERIQNLQQDIGSSVGVFINNKV